MRSAWSPGAIPLGRIGGCTIAFDSALILALAYLAWTLVDRYATLQTLTEIMPFEMAASPTTWAVLVTGGLLVSLVVHELAHAGAARLAGGRVRAVTLSLLGGPTRVVAPGRMAAVEWRAALAGPVASALLGVAAMAGAGAVSLSHADVHLALYDLGRLNLGYAAVQLIPAWPFDGGRILRAVTSRRMGVVAASRLASSFGKALAAACVAVAVAQHEIPLLFASILLYAGTVEDAQDDAMATPLEGLTAREAALPIAHVATVHDLCGEVALVLSRLGVTAVPILANDGAPLGAISAADLRAVPPRRRWVTTLGDILPRVGGLVPLEAPLDRVRRRMVMRRVGAVAVVDAGGHLAGVLPLEAIDRRADLAELVAPERELYGMDPAAPAPGEESPAPVPAPAHAEDTAPTPAA